MNAPPDPLLITSVRRGNVLPLGNTCNLSCTFCSNHFNPDRVHTLSLPPLTLEDIRALLPLLDPLHKVVIGESATRINEGEPLLHPHLLEILRLVRATLPRTPLQITTNGVLLEDCLQRDLAQLAPIELVISVNALDPERRRRQLGDPMPQRTLDRLAALRGNKLPFQASFVLAPLFLPEFPDALQRVERWGADYIRLLLPGGSRFAPASLQGSWQDWLKLRQQTRQWRLTSRIPCVLEPPILLDLRAEVEGVRPGSPAEQAGLQAGDLIESVEGEPPFSRQDAYQHLLARASPNLTISREGTTYQIHLKKRAGETSGLVFLRDLSRQSLERSLERLPSRGCGLALTGELAAPVLHAAWEKLSLDIPLVTVRNRSFGGSIRAAGLLTLEDFRFALQDERTRGTRWDWLLLPSVSFEEGIDLMGDSLDGFEREAGCPVFPAEP